MKRSEEQKDGNKKSYSEIRRKNIKIYLEMAKAHSKTLNKELTITLNGKRYIVHPSGRIYKDINLNNF